ncbi:response regulator [Emticicia sp. SJ17W-69]|uniref:response regulator n=1 Tax=Emticicia sp. SJ17W-69 TaxID=3421657 RepID=UPI003EB836D1
MKPKIIIADDHLLVNDGIKYLLSTDYDIVAQVIDGGNVIEVLHRFVPDAILLDINLPNKNGFKIAEEIKRSFGNIKIVFLTMYSEMRFIEKARLLEVHGYMLKHSTKEELVECLNAVLINKTYYDPKLEALTINLHQKDNFVKQFAISPRELDVINLICKGLNSQGIAQKLSVSVETVKTHRKNIYYKLGINSVFELVEFVDKNSLS